VNATGFPAIMGTLKAHEISTRLALRWLVHPAQRYHKLVNLISGNTALVVQELQVQADKAATNGTPPRVMSEVINFVRSLKVHTDREEWVNQLCKELGDTLAFPVSFAMEPAETPVDADTAA